MAYVSTEQMKEIRKELKALCPSKEGWKLSVTRRHYSTVCVAIMKSPISFDVHERGYETINHHWYKDHGYTEVQQAVFGCILKAIYKGFGGENYDRNAGDMGADYCDCNYYIDLQIGKFDKPCVFVD